MYPEAMIDTHCHLTFPPLRARIDEIRRTNRAAGVRGMITIATTCEGCRENLELARRYEDVWCSAGVHPLYADEPIDWALVREAGRDPRCVAWGELGLDMFHKTPALDRQRAVLEEQLAQLESWSGDGLDKPVVLHCRDAFEELIPMLESSSLPNESFVFHCFTGGPDEARSVLDFGAMISFTGVATYRNAEEVAEAARVVPEERIMVETDAPYLSPEPVRGSHPNLPENVVHTARFIAGLRKADFGAFEAVLDANAERFFRIVLPG